MKKLTFDNSAKRMYYVYHDDCRDEYVALRGKHALGKDGVDHIYLIDEDTVAVWITSQKINRTIMRLMGQVPGLKVEQLGDTEAVLSAPLASLYQLCKAAGARGRPQLSSERKRQLIKQGESFRFSKKHAIEKRSKAQKSTNRG